MSSPVDEQALHQERAELILALNGNPVNAEMAWQIIHRWDALVNVAKAAEEEHSDCPLVLCDTCEALAALDKEPA